MAHEELNSFLDLAEDLRVKGLTQNQSGSHGFKKDLINQPQLSQSSQEPKEDPTVLPTPAHKPALTDHSIPQQ